MLHHQVLTSANLNVALHSLVLENGIEYGLASIANHEQRIMFAPNVSDIPGTRPNKSQFERMES